MRSEQGRFEPGRSGNPRGRPKRDLEVAELAREHPLDAIAALAEITTDRKAPASARVAAAVAMLDRGYGRPPQSLDVTQRLTLAEEFEAFLRETRAERLAVPSLTGCSVGRLERQLPGEDLPLPCRRADGEF